MFIRTNILLILISVLAAASAIAQPEVTVKGGGYEILDAASTWPDSTGQSFGVHQANIGSKTNTFWIYNTGTSDLTLSNFRVTTVYNTQFNITTPTKLIITPGDSVSFDVEYAPNAAGTHGRTTGGSGVCVAAFDTDDVNESTYDFRISGVATADPAFVCSAGRMLFSHLGGGTDLKEWNYGEQPPTLGTISNALTWNHDGMALNPNDNYIYTIRYNTGSRNQLWVLSSTGVANFVGYIYGAGVTNNMGKHASAGAFDDNENLYAFYNQDATSSLRRINVKSQLAESITLSDPVYIRGAIYNTDDGLLYGFSAGATHDGLVSVDPNDGTVTYIGGDGDLSYAAMFRSTDGAVYMMSQTYSMYLVDLTDGNIELIGTNPGWGNGTWVDGCACGEIKAEADVNITVDDNRPSYTPGSTQTYTITVKNNGPWGSYRDTVRNALPAGVTLMNWTTTTYGTAVSDNASGTGALEDVLDISVGDSVVYTVKVVVPPGFTGNLVNSASVTASTVLTDPDMSNNSVSDTDVIFSLASEQCNNGFDDDGNGDVDCFDGDCAGNSVCASHYTNGVIPDCPDTPDVASFSMKQQWTSTAGEDYVTPVVGDMDADGIPELVTVNYGNGRLYVLNGQDGSQITNIAYQGTYHNFSGGAAIADIDNDGTAEVFLVTGNAQAGVAQNNCRQWISCFDYDNGTLTQRYRVSYGQINLNEYSDQKWAVVQFADFDEDGTPELFIGNHVMNAITGAIIASPTVAQRNSWPRGRLPGGSYGDYMSAAYDVLPDAACATCNGLELICGNTVYAVDLSNPTNNQNGITVATQMTPTGTYTDGLTSLADWDGDGEMDIIVTGFAGGTANFYIWNPRADTVIIDRTNIPNGGDGAGRASIADFDGDGNNELAIVSKNRLHLYETDGSIKWTLNSIDNSSKTSATAFDFEGDGNMEVVYRDEQNLRILDGVTGNVKDILGCVSGTRVEMPVVADVDADGETEICVSCESNTRVYTSDQTPWMPTRKVWNSVHYVPTFINDDLTIPAQRQPKATTAGKDLYAAQVPITDPAGNLIYPALPDFMVTFDSSTIASCDNDSTLVHVTICNDDANALLYNYPISYYDGEPNSGGTLIGTRTISISDVTVISTSCYSYSFNAPNQPTDLYIIANDDGTGNFGYPTIGIEECDSTNNATNGEIGCPLDAAITKDDGRLSYIPGGALTYEIVVKNNGPSFTGGIVSDPLPVGISTGDISWTATTYGGATTTASGTTNGALKDTVDIPGGDSVVYTVTIVTPANLTGNLVNVASINVVGDSIPDNNTASDTDTIDCTFAIAATVNSKHSSWTQIGTVVGGFTYNFSTAGGTKTFTPGSGPESGQQITTVVYNTGTGFSVSLSRYRYNNSNIYHSTLTHYDSSPHGWTGLSGSGYEQAPVLGFMAFVDRNGNGSYDSGTDDFIRDVNTLNITPVNSGELYLAFYDDGVYSDNNGLINIESSIDPIAVDFAVSDTIICDGDSILLDAGNPGAVSWVWSNGETAQSFQAKTTGEYSVVVTAPGGCQAVDTINIIVGCETDLEATKTDGVSSYTRGGTNIYTIVAKNNGPLDVQNATVFDTIPNGVNSFSWTATLHGTASNASGLAGSGAISDLVDLAVGDSIVYTVTAAVSTYKFGELANTVTIFTPEGREDSDSTNNIATDIDTDPDPTSCFIMMTDFEDYVNCTAPSYNDLTAAYAGNSVWVNSNHTAGLFVHDPGTCTNIPGVNILPDTDGGTAYAGLHSPLSGDPTKQEVIIGTLPTSLLANQEYEISFLSVSMNIWGDATWDNYGEIDFFGIAEGTSPTLDLITQENWTTISAIPEVDHLGTSATITNRAEWEEYAFKFTPTRDLDRLLLAPRGDWTFIGIDNIVVKVASPALKIDTLTICEGSITDTVIPYTITSGNPDQFTIDWDAAANAVGIADVAQTSLPVGNQFTLMGLGSVPIGNYTAEISTYNTALGCERIDSILFVVAANPKVDLGNDTSICNDSSVILDALNPNADSWAWSDATNTQTNSVNSGNTYSVIVTDTNSCLGFDTITVSQVALIDLSIGNDTSICTGDSLIISFNQPIGATILWNTGSFNDSITINTGDTYSVLVTDSNGCPHHDTLILSLNALPMINLGNDTTICPDSSLTISSLEGNSWDWNTGENSQSINLTVSGTYGLEIVDINGCENSDSIEVKIASASNIALGNDTSICDGETLTLDAGNGENWSWNNLETSQAINVSTAATYIVNVTYASGCIFIDSIELSIDTLPLISLGDDTVICEQASIVLDAGAGVLWNWNTTESLQTITVNSANDYDVTLTDGNGCIGRDTIRITTNSLPTVQLGNDTAFCPDSTIVIDGGSASSWSWSSGSSSQAISINVTGTYYLTITDANDCENIDSIVVDLLPRPLIELDDASTYCQFGDRLYLEVVESSADYLWSTGSTDQEIEVVTEGLYYVDVTDNLGCFNSDTIIINTPMLTIDLGGDQSICSGEPLDLDAGAFAYEIWNSTDTADVYTAAVGGQVDVVAIDSDGCFGTDTITITENANPTIEVTQQDSAICDLIGETTILTVTDSEGMDISWNTGEMGQSITANEQGEYIATKTSGFNCSSSDSAYVDRYCQDQTFTLPDIFVPNGDGTNDALVPIEDPIKLQTYFITIQFIVYNRWGRVMFMSYNQLPNWNGTFLDTGEPCAAGTYYWVLDYKEISGKRKKTNGFVQIVR